MKAVVFDGIGLAEVREMPYPEPKADEIVIKVMASGLCGTDAHIFKGAYPAQYPLIPGHEFSGVVDSVGTGVAAWKAGDRVAADPNKYCGHCYHCLSERGNMCQNASASGVTRHGGLAQYVAVPATNAYKLPDNVSFADGAFIEPLSCCVYAMKRLAVGYGDRALVFGAGPMGLLMLKCLLTGGASQVVCVDMVPERLEAAVDIGAYAALRTFDALERHTDDAGKYDIVVDATGNAQVIERMFAFAGKRAKILQFGCADANAKVSISPFDLYDNDWQYIGTRANCFTFNQAIALMQSGAVTGAGIVNDFITLEQVPDYIRGERPGGSLKAMALPWQR